MAKFGKGKRWVWRGNVATMIPFDEDKKKSIDEIIERHQKEAIIEEERSKIDLIPTTVLPQETKAQIHAKQMRDLDIRFQLQKIEQLQDRRELPQESIDALKEMVTINKEVYNAKNQFEDGIIDQEDHDFIMLDIEAKRQSLLDQAKSVIKEEDITRDLQAVFPPGRLKFQREEIKKTPKEEEEQKKKLEDIEKKAEEESKPLEDTNETVSNLLKQIRALEKQVEEKLK